MAQPVLTPHQVPAPPAGPGRRLVCIDALRGLAALMVVLYHCYYHTMVGANGESLRGWAGFLWPGFSGVYLFFVISGFCIHLRWTANRAQGRPEGIRFLDFWKRRIRRLYPPYLVALAIYLLVLAGTGELKYGGFFWYDLATHLSLLHSLDARTVYSINGVFWTLSLEELLYLAYFLLLRMRLRFGWPLTLSICLAVRVAWFALCYLLHRVAHVDLPVMESLGAQWFVWALGAVAVEAAYGLVKVPRWLSHPCTAGALLLLATGVSLVELLTDTQGIAGRLSWIASHPLWGLAYFSLVTSAVRKETGWTQSKGAPRWVRVAAATGLFSYSLYLTHELILSHLAPALAAWMGFPRTTGFLVLLTPLCVAFAWIFFWLFERPFLSPSKSSPALSV